MYIVYILYYGHFAVPCAHKYIIMVLYYYITCCCSSCGAVVLTFVKNPSSQSWCNYTYRSYYTKSVLFLYYYIQT